MLVSASKHCTLISRNIVSSATLFPLRSIPPISSRTIMSSSYAAAPTSATARMTVSSPEPSSPHRVKVPSFYTSSPPPHWASVSNGRPTRFQPPWDSAKGEKGLFGILKGRMTEWDERPLPPPESLPKVNHIQWNDIIQQATSNTPQIRYTWIGHAGCHVQLPVPVTSGDGSVKYHYVSVLTDPVLSRRCSPVQFMGPERFTDAPTSVRAMAEAGPGAWPDIVAISHNHYDHTDLATVRALADPSSGQKRPHFVVSLGTKQWFVTNTGLPNDAVTEMDWWDDIILSIPVAAAKEAGTARVRFTFVPAQHFSARGLGDRNATLWGGYVFQALASSDQAVDESLAKVYFVGDTGYRTISRGISRAEEEALPYCTAFEDIGSALGPMDLSLIPIGAYRPRSMFSTIHVAPHESVKIHKAVKSRKSLGIHWGVFRLTSEDVDEPPRHLKEAVVEAGLEDKDFGVVGIGETVDVSIGDK